MELPHERSVQKWISNNISNQKGSQFDYQNVVNRKSSSLDYAQNKEKEIALMTPIALAQFLFSTFT